MVFPGSCEKDSLLTSKSIQADTRLRIEVLFFLCILSFSGESESRHTSSSFQSRHFQYGAVGLDCAAMAVRRMVCSSNSRFGSEYQKHTGMFEDLRGR